MTQNQFNAACKKLGLGTHQRVADFFGVSHRTARRLAEVERVEQSYAMLLRLAIRYKLPPDVMVEEFGD